MFVCVKKKQVALVGLLVVIILASVILMNFSSKTEYVYTIPKSKYTVVIDAGHGGIDGGSVGKNTGVFESDLNLAFSKNLAHQLNNFGISVVMTRMDEGGLYDKSATNLKRSEMKKRQSIIETSNADMVISIHMNSFPLQSPRGAQAFYKANDEMSFILAQDVQQELSNQIDYAKENAKVGDYYILNCTATPSVLVECGFLSNPQEEVLLQNKDYQEKFCYALCCGIIKYLNENEQQ